MREEKQYYVYILTNKRNGTLYIGITSNLADRIDKHKKGMYDGFTKKYKVDNLIYFETYGDIREAITREKQMKKWDRRWKLELIEKNNPEWKDLFNDLFKNDNK